MRRQLILSLALVTATAVAADAQVRQRERVQADSVRVWRDGDRAFAYIFGPNEMRMDLRRGRLGIVVALAPDAARDSVGALVDGVTPGGPADRAGVRSGDIILRLNGVRLGVTDPADRDDFESRPGRRLINLASRLNPGDSVRLEVRREGRSQSFTFRAAESDLDVIVERLRTPGGIREIEPLMPRLPFAEGDGRVRIFPFVGAMGVSELEMVRVSPELASGLGISEGLLVVDVGRDTALGLRAGDVVVSIGGRRPTSPSHAMRILSTYGADEQISFEVMRQRRRQTVTGRLPRRQELRWRNIPNDFEIPVPGLRLRVGPMEPGRRGESEIRVVPPGLRQRVEAEPGTQLPAKRVEA
jgi:hypothetical protein